MKITLRRSSGAALALAGLLALGACGSSDTGSGDKDTSTSTSEKAASGDTIDAGDLAKRMATAMQKAGSGTMAMETGGESAKGDFRYVDGKLEQHTNVPVQGQAMEIIAIGDFVYLKGLPGQAKPWVKIDPKASDPISQMFKNMAEGGVSDPAKMAGNLKGTEAKVKSKDGDNTTYEFEVEAAKALGATASPSPSPSASAPAQTKFTITYVLDKEDRPVTISTMAGGQEIKVAYSDWGKKVDITEPPADQVGPMSFPSGAS
ncbi:hypothetical protein N802_08150 [Knoellia sinensis KCTC 19936]|uniref:Lipoprotein n=1 Tax=Knoellia sinensis KCTC 19936 TaxID=1385520 RepID=A0A0A0JA10_9MICO|nr:hypothetical protein [Knoellia sinensis]KGN33958.1 hypothetical protein N802_08150 [Knoellia sinensis KCTC 19936]